MIELLGKLIDAGQYSAVTIIFLIIFFVIIFGAFIIYQFVKKLSFKKLKGKIAGQEYEFSGDEGDNNPKEVIEIKSTDMLTFSSVVQQIIDYSVDNGNQASLKRQQLYDSQMRYIKDRFEGITTQIIFEYNNIESASSLIEVIWNTCLRNAILNKLEAICKADRLVERTKDKLIEEHRVLIDNSYQSIIREFQKYSIKNINKELKITFQANSLLEVIEKHKVDLSSAITDCLSHSWDEANSYFEEIKELRKQLSNNITNALKSYFPSDQHCLIPTKWYDYDKLPPNEVVGGKL